MKKKLIIITTLLIILTGYSGNSQIYQSSCEDIDVNLFFEDACSIVLNRIYSENSSYKDSIDIPISEVYSVMGKLSAIYNGPFFAIDTIYYHLDVDFNTCAPIMNSIQVTIDTSFAWTHNWLTGNYYTGNNQIDSLMDKYNLLPSGHWSNAINTFVYLAALNPLNLPPLLNKLQTFSGITDAAFGPCINDNWWTQNSVITGTSDSLFDEFIYDYAWGDPWGGGVAHHYWKFRVYPDCSVEYMGSYGVPLFNKIDETRIDVSDIAVWPNPASGELNLKMDCYSNNKPLIYITDIMGNSDEITPRENIASEKSYWKLDLSHFQSGTYFLKFIRNNTVFATKIVVIH